MSELSEQPKVHTERFLYLRQIFIAVILHPLMFMLHLQLHGAETGVFQKLRLKHWSVLDRYTSLQSTTPSTLQYKVYSPPYLPNIFMKLLFVMHNTTVDG